MEYYNSITYPPLMNLIASYALLIFIMGNIGPNISSCMMGSVGFTSISTVGEIYFSAGFTSPPTAIVPLPFK